MTKGNAKLNTNTNTFNALSFVIQQTLWGVNTCEPVKVIAVSNGFVDVEPLVYSVNGDGDTIPTSNIYSLPYVRLQSGNNGIIIDPQVGDIGLAVYCQRDITGVKSAKQKTIPFSKRKFNKADGVFIGGLANINQMPTRLIQFTDDGIVITGENKVTINAETVINGNTSINGDLSVTGNSTASDHISGGISGKLHIHGGVTGGNAKTNVPE